MAGRDEDRAADLHAMLADPEVRAIVCLQGGYGTPRLIPLLDEGTFAANPKAICGYSDLTTLHLAASRWGNVISFYSNGASGVGAARGHRLLEEDPPSGAVQRRAVRADRPEPGRPVCPDHRRRPRDRPAGRRLRRPPGERDRDPAAAGLPGPDRRPRGDRARGLRPRRDPDPPPQRRPVRRRGGDRRRRPQDEVVRRASRSSRPRTSSRSVLAPLGLPLIFGLPIGHGKHHATVPLGAMATLDARQGHADRRGGGHRRSTERPTMRTDVAVGGHPVGQFPPLRDGGEARRSSAVRGSAGPTRRRDATTPAHSDGPGARGRSAWRYRSSCRRGRDDGRRGRPDPASGHRPGPPGPDPWNSVVVADFEVFTLNYDLLVNFGADLEPVPGFAESWSPSADGKTWTFKIRPGMKWSDGQPATSEDARCTYQTVLDAVASERGYLGEGYLEPYLTNAGLKKVTAPDPTTLVVETEFANTLLLQAYVPILPKHIWSKHTLEQIGTPEAAGFFKNEPPVVGTGPYQAVEWKPGDFIRFARNPNYWGTAGRGGRGDHPALRQPGHDGPGAQDGRDRLRPRRPRRPVQRLEDRAERRDRRGPRQRLHGAVVQHRRQQEGLRRLDARRCPTSPSATPSATRSTTSSSSTPRSAATATPGSTIIPPFHTRWHVDPATPRTFDIEEAKKRLDAAGYKLDSSNKRLDKDGKVINLRLTWPDSESENATNAQFLVEWFGQLGITVTAAVTEEGKLIDDVTGPPGRPGELRHLHVGLGRRPGSQLAAELLHDRARSAASSDSFYSNPRYDELFLQQRAEPDPAKRKAILDEMQQLVYDEAPYHILYYDAELHAYRTDKFAGWTNQPTDGRHAALRLRLARLHAADRRIGAALGRSIRCRVRGCIGRRAAQSGRPRHPAAADPARAPARHLPLDPRASRRSSWSSPSASSSCAAGAGRSRRNEPGGRRRRPEPRARIRRGASTALLDARDRVRPPPMKGGYLWRRLASAFVTIVLITLVNFILFRAMPGLAGAGDPARHAERHPRPARERPRSAGASTSPSSPTSSSRTSGRPSGATSATRSSPAARPSTDVLAQRIWPTIILFGLGEVLAIVSGWRSGRTRAGDGAAPSTTSATACRSSSTRRRTSCSGWPSCCSSRPRSAGSRRSGC